MNIKLIKIKKDYKEVHVGVENLRDVRMGTKKQMSLKSCLHGLRNTRKIL